MKTPKPIILLLLLTMQLMVSAQIQWYQNQDSNNPAPYGTVANTVQLFTSSTFIASYLWRSENEMNTWKISKGNINRIALRSHWLADGIINNSNKLIAIDNTSDFDTATYSNNYFRSFAIRLGVAPANNNCYFGRPGSGDEEIMEEKLVIDEAEEERVELTTKLVIYPNPVQNQLNITNIDPEEFDRVVVYNMQGAMLQQKNITASTMRMDISNLPDGVYLLVLHSSVSLKEKNFKFVVRK